MQRHRLIGLPLIGMLLAAGCSANVGRGGGEPLEVGSTPQAASSDGLTETSPVRPSDAASDAATPATADASPSSGVSSFGAGPAGTVTLLVEDRTLTLDGVVLATGWQQAGEPREGAELRIDFTGPDDRQVRFEAEVEADGTLDIDTEERRAAADGTATIDLPESAGNATFTAVGGRITLDGVIPADGWDARERERDDDSFEVDFVNADQRVKVELSVEIDDGRLEVDIETRHGPGFESGDDDADDDADDD